MHRHETAGGPTYPGDTCDVCGTDIPRATESPSIGSAVLAGPVDAPAELRPARTIVPYISSNAKVGPIPVTFRR